MAKAKDNAKDDGGDELETAKPSKKNLTLDLIDDFLKKNKKDHLNFVKELKYKVSTGSLNLDIELGGGIRPGVVRIGGASEAGKTSLSLEIARNFQKLGLNDFVVYFNAEGRLTDDLKARCGVDFSEEKWLTYDSNIYESCIDLMRHLITNNPENKQYLFIFDSADNLIPRAEAEKKAGEAAKVGSSAVLLTALFKKLSVFLPKIGHIAIFIGQVRATIEDKYAAKEARKQDSTSAAAANSLIHNSSLTIEMYKRGSGDLILKNPSNKIPDKIENPIVGHSVKMILKKTFNEKSNIPVEYPVRYGAKGCSSVWRSIEVVDQMKLWGLVEGSNWLTFSNVARSKMDELIKNKSLKLEVPEKIQGENNLRKFLEENPDVMNMFYDFIVSIAMEV